MGLREWLLETRSSSWLSSCTAVGPEARLRARPVVINQGRLTIGARFQLSSVPVVSHLYTAPEGALEIGDGVTISFGAAIACLSRVRIGSDTRIGPYFALSDSDFHVVGNRDARPDARPVEIGRGVRIGARVTVSPGCKIGDGATVVAGSTVAGVVAAGAVVSGVPARICRAAERTAGAASTEDAVRSLVARTLGLSRVPELADGPPQIPEWDSLGALRLLLAVEEEFGVRIDERDMLGAHRVADLVAILDGRRAAPTGAMLGDAAVQLPGQSGPPVLELIRRTLELSQLPDFLDGPDQIPQWDSLGALRILLAVEEEFSIQLGEQDMARVRSVADLIAMVERARKDQTGMAGSP